MDEERRTCIHYSAAEILGIYGQNGSGKTAIVDALHFLQQIMIGQTVDQRISDYIGVNDDKAHMNAEFKIFGRKKVYEVGYNISLKKQDGEVVIEREFLNCAINHDSKRTNKNIFMDFVRSETECIFKPQKRLDELIGKNKDLRTDLIVARKMAEKSSCSFVFGESSREIFCGNVEEKFKDYSSVIKALFEFALKDLFVIRNTHSGMITANFLLPMAFRIGNNKMGAKGAFVMSEKKVIAIIVEGPSDENAIGGILKEYFSSEEVQFAVVHGDIISNEFTTVDNVVTKITALIDGIKIKYGYQMRQ